MTGQTELVLAPFRAYDPALGRWLSPDPITETGGINLYQYSFGSPMNFTDPLGLLPPYGMESGSGLQTGSTQEQARVATGVAEGQQDLEAVAAGTAAVAGVTAVAVLVAAIPEAVAAITRVIMGNPAATARAIATLDETGCAGAALATGAATKAASRTLPQFSNTTIQAVLASSRRAVGQLTEGARAIAKKLGHAEGSGCTSAFQGLRPTQQNAETIIGEIMSSPARTFYGDKVIDIYDSCGRGIRIDAATNKFIGFLEEALATQ